MQPLNHSVSIQMLILFLQIRGHCCKHGTTYIECIIASLLMSSTICTTRASREVIRVWFCNNILSFLLPKNNSQVAVPIHKISSIDLFLLKQVSHPGSEKTKPKPLYVCPGCSNHTYSNNMVNRYNISINYRVKSYKMTRGSKRKITE
jgi:hypothetical protein